MSSRVFVVGGTVQLGRVVVSRFISGGWAVTVASRSGPRFDTSVEAVQQVRLDRTQPDALGEVLPDSVDALVDVVPMTVEDADQLLGVADRIGCLIVISTGSVYSDNAGRTLDEATDDSTFPRYPVPLAETQRTVAPGQDTYSTRKAAMERRLLQSTAVPVTVLRPFAVHAPGSPGPREWWVVKRCLDGRPYIPVAGRGHSRFHTTSVGNLAELAWLAANRPGTRVLNAADPTALTVREITEAILAVLDSTAAPHPRGWIPRAAGRVNTVDGVPRHRRRHVRRREGTGLSAGYRLRRISWRDGAVVMRRHRAAPVAGPSSRPGALPEGPLRLCG